MSTLPEDFDTPEDRGPPPEMMDPFLDLRGALTPTMQWHSLFHQRHWLDYLVELGALKIGDGYSIHVNQRGFITAVGIDVLPVERLRYQPSVMLFGAGGKERFQQQVMENINFLTAPDLQGPSPVADKIIATICNAPIMRYVVWNRVLNTLHTAPPEGRTPASLVELLQPAIRQEDQIWAWLEDFDEQLSMEALVRINKTNKTLLAERIRDLMGIEASHQNPLRAIKAALPGVYESSVRPVFRIIRYIRSDDEYDAMKTMYFDTFVVYWKHLKRQLKSNKLAPSMREHLERLEGRPLPPQREGLSNLHETQRPGEPVIIDLT